MGKLKKLLAMGLIGVVGAASLTGCSLTSDQQASLDMLVSKTEELTQVIEKQNTELSKKEAASLANIARKNAVFLDDDGLFVMKYKNEAYEGNCVSKLNIGNFDQTLYYYVDAENNRETVFTTDESGTLRGFAIDDLKNNKYYNNKPSADGAQYTNSCVPGQALEFAMSYNALLALDDFEEDDLYNVEETKNGYKFSFILTKNGYLMNVAADTEKSTVTYKVTMEIDNDCRLLNCDIEAVYKEYNSSSVLLAIYTVKEAVTYEYNSTKDISSYKTQLATLMSNATLAS